jgi:asparagine synthase (glutamine-hydrolysing)
LDNREELLHRFQWTGDSTATITDSQLILAAYEKWGDRCPEYLLGDFAFAIWDEPQQSLFLARDHFGVKPLYYYCDERLFAFATEIKALLTLPDIPRKLNEEQVADYLLSAFEDQSLTFYQNILRLPAAHQLKIDAHGYRLQTYWALDPTRELHLKSDSDYADAFLEHFTSAVNCRLRSALPIGSLLSGGLDSSSITCIARNLLSHRGKAPLKTFSAIFQQVQQCDESNFIEAVIAQGDIEPNYVKADQISPLTNLQQMFWHEDEAFYAPNLFMHWGLYHSAKAQGVRILLDGFDGDTTVSHGIPYMADLAREGQWLRLMREIRGFSHNFERPLGPLLWRYAWGQGVLPHLPATAQRLTRRINRKWKSSSPPTLKLQPEFAKRLNLQERIQKINASRSNDADTARRAHYRRLTWGVLPFTLEVADRAAAAHHIEPRFPFFDKRLVEFCLAIPPEQKIHHGWTRMVMRRAMDQILPPEVQWRAGKSDLSPNFHYGLRVLERDRLAQVLREDTGLIEPYVDVTVLRQTFQRFLADESMPDSNVLSIWKPVLLALWLKQADLNR